MKARKKVLIILLIIFSLTEISLLSVFVWLKVKKPNENGMGGNYEAKGVHCVVSASKIDGTTGAEIYFLTSDGQNEIEFKPNSTNEGNLSISDTSLNNDDFIVFVYKFENKNSSTKLNVDVTENTTKKNVNITYKIVDAKLEFNQFDTISEIELTDFDVEKLNTKYVYVKVEIKDTNNNAEYSGGFNWDLR